MDAQAAEALASHPAAPDLARAIADRYTKPLAIARYAMQEFVDKVDRGEARSKRSYAAFKHALASIDEAFPNLSPIVTPSPAVPDYARLGIDDPEGRN